MSTKMNNDLFFLRSVSYVTEFRVSGPDDFTLGIHSNSWLVFSHFDEDGSFVVTDGHGVGPLHRLDAPHSFQIVC